MGSVRRDSKPPHRTESEDCWAGGMGTRLIGSDPPMRVSGGPALRRHESTDALLLVPPLPSPRRPDRRPTAACRDPSAHRRRAALGYRPMVRERVGDWRLAWRFALAGLIAGLLVSAFAYAGVINRSFDAAQDQLFPAPSAIRASRSSRS